jgi:hypothetical protein
VVWILDITGANLECWTRRLEERRKSFGCCGIAVLDSDDIRRAVELTAESSQLTGGEERKRLNTETTEQEHGENREGEERAWHEFGLPFESRAEAGRRKITSKVAVS